MGFRLAKLSQPGVNGCHPRTRLFDQLDRAGGCRGIWVTAPAGAGKTTLAASYAKHHGLTCLWYTLDAGDAEPATWFGCLGAAAQPETGGRVNLPALTPEFLLGLPAFTRNFFETLCAHLPKPGLVVFDDYQEVPDGAPLHALMAEALAVVPDGITVLVLSRKAPPPAVARLLANRRVATLGWKALRLTAEETAGVAARMAQTEDAGPVDARYAADPRFALDALHEMTDGWVAGLILLLESARSGDWSAETVSRMDRSVLFDYFAGEVLEREPEVIRRLLLATPDPRQLSEATAVALSGRADAGRILERLVRRGLFTYRTAADPPTYQYHPLLREFLLDRVELILTADARAAQRRTAARALAAEGQVDDAARLATEAADWDTLSGLILSQAQPMMTAGRHAVLREWIERLPEPLATRPWLDYWRGICRLAGSPTAARPILERVHSRFEKQGDVDGQWLALVGVLQSIIFSADDFHPLDPWIERARRLRGENSFPASAIAARVAIVMVNALQWRAPQSTEYEIWRNFLNHTADSGTDDSVRLMAGYQTAMFHVSRGRPALMQEALARLREQVDVGAASPFAQIHWYTAEAICSWLVADFERCDRFVTLGLSSCEKYGLVVLSPLLIAQAMHAAMSRGRVAEVAGHAKRIMAALPPRQMRVMRAYWRRALVWPELEAGNLAAATALAREAYADAEASGTPFHITGAAVALADCLWTEGEEEQARALHQKVKAIGEAGGSEHVQLTNGVVAADGLLRAGRTQDGLAALREGFSAAARVDLFNHMWWRPKVMARLCATALEHGIEPSYTRKLIRKHGLLPETPPLAKDGWPWVVTVKTLGGFELEVGGEPLRFSSKTQKKPLELLKAMVDMGDWNRPVAVDRLGDALWPDSDGDAAAQAFRATLSRLRKLIGADAVVTADGHVQLDPRRCWVDAWAMKRFSRSVSSGPRRPSSRSTGARSRRGTIEPRDR